MTCLVRNQYTLTSFRPEHLASMAKLRFEEYGGRVAEHRRALERLLCRNPAGTGEGSLAVSSRRFGGWDALNAALPLAFKNEPEAKSSSLDAQGRPLMKYTSLRE